MIRLPVGLALTFSSLFLCANSQALEVTRANYDAKSGKLRVTLAYKNECKAQKFRLEVLCPKESKLAITELRLRTSGEGVCAGSFKENREFSLSAIAPRIEKCGNARLRISGDKGASLAFAYKKRSAPLASTNVQSHEDPGLVMTASDPEGESRSAASVSEPTIELPTNRKEKDESAEGPVFFNPRLENGENPKFYGQ